MIKINRLQIELRLLPHIGLQSYPVRCTLICEAHIFAEGSEA